MTDSASPWHKTACNLCYVNCALEVQTEGRTITRIRGDKDNPRTAGYLCQKPQRLTWYGDHDDRLTTPLRRRHPRADQPGDGAERDRRPAARGPRRGPGAGSARFVRLRRGGGQGNHSGGGYGHALLRWMNSTRFFFNRARNVVNTIKNDPDRTMIVLDPRRTETAAVADVHLPLRPGTDAYLLGAVLALIIERQGADERFLEAHTEGRCSSLSCWVSFSNGIGCDVMKRTSFANWPCSVARTMDLLGDWWTPLVLREAFYGIRRFDEFQQGLGIARNTLADRLRRLVEEGLLEKRAYQRDPVRHDYVLTEKGRDFFGVIAAMSRWGDRWMSDEAGPPVTFHHRSCGHDTHAEVVCAHCREPLDAEDTVMRMGPGYPPRLAQRPDVQRRFGVGGDAATDQPA